MPLYDVEVMQTIRYKKRFRAANEDEAREKGQRLWMEYMSYGVKFIDDEWIDVSVYPTAWGGKKQGRRVVGKQEAAGGK